MTCVSILCTDPRHGVNAWLERWAVALAPRVEVRICRDWRELTGGDVLFLVSCHQIIGATVRAKFKHTLVLHASALPAGRGMSPHIWQILDGCERLTMTLLEAEDELDTGRIWHQIEVPIPDTAVCAEINALIFDAEIALMDWALAHRETVVPREQVGEGSMYRKRVPADSRIDPLRPLVDSFDLLRVADPDRYPAFFEHRGRTYRLRIDPL
ncbi:MAG: formyltransferase family protein [Rhizobacter sp.]